LASLTASSQYRESYLEGRSSEPAAEKDVFQWACREKLKTAWLRDKFPAAMLFF
jgi:hypothetical protein